MVSMGAPTGSPIRHLRSIGTEEAECNTLTLKLTVKQSVRFDTDSSGGSRYWQGRYAPSFAALLSELLPSLGLASTRAAKNGDGERHENAGD